MRRDLVRRESAGEVDDLLLLLGQGIQHDELLLVLGSR